MEQSVPSEPLTDREAEVLRLMAEGLSNRDIADLLVIDVETVRWHTKNIYGKLGVGNRTQAVLVARRQAEDMTTASTNLLPAPLPAYTTTFIGRRREIDDLTALLENPDARLVTLVGPGGIGKTRLSIEVARRVAPRFADGIAFVALASETTPDQVALAIARALRLDIGAETGKEQLLQALQPRALLLLLDNCDQAEAGDMIVGILGAAPGVKVLATSLRSLNLGMEWVRRIGGIACPPADGDADIEAYDAVALFVDRVRRVRGDFSLDEEQPCVVEICRLVEGVPLALELASGWLKTLSCAEVAAEILRNIDFLAASRADADERHRSMRAVFDYSWRLLSDEERRMLLKLSVFRGGFGRAIAEQIAGASLSDLATLIDKSFLYLKEPQVYEVHDLLRRYIQEKLEQESARNLTTRSNMLSAWVSLVKGDFERVEELALYFLNHNDNPAGRAFGLALRGVLAGVGEDYTDCLRLCKASVTPVTPGISADPLIGTFADLGMTIGYCGLGQFASARAHLRSALQRALTLHSPAFVILCLPLSAVLEHASSAEEAAVELLALASTHPASTPTWLQKWPLLARLHDDLRVTLDASTYASAWERGRALIPEDIATRLIARMRA